MTQPTPYVREFSFTDFSATSPSNPPPGTALDAEFNGIKTTLDGATLNLAIIQRDDGALANESVGVDQLDPTVRQLVGSGAFKVRSDGFVVGGNYSAGDVFEADGSIYLATAPFVAAADIGTNIAAGVTAALSANPGLSAPRGLSFARPKPRAYDRLTAVSMARDLTAMAGWAKVAGTTGGNGGPIYWITENSDDAARTNTLRWAVAQIAANGSGIAIFDPRNEFDFPLQSRIDVPANSTIIAPGRNVKIKPPSGITAFNIQFPNVIIRMLELTETIDPTGINNKGTNPDTGGPANAADGFSINPEVADRVWIDENTLDHISDGAIDVSSSGLTTATANICRYTISRNIIRGHYKCMLAGSNSSAPADTDVNAARKVFGLYMGNWYDHTAERHPRVAGLAYVDSVNNVFDLAQLHTDEGLTGEYGAASLYGGWLRTRGDLFRTLDGVATLAVQRSDGTAGIPTAACKNEGSVAEGTLTIQTGSEAVLTDLPAVGYDVVPQAVPNGTGPRNAFRDAIRAAAGARAEAMPSGMWVFNPDSTANLDGLTARAAPELGGGRYILISDQTTRVPAPPAGSASTLVLKRGPNVVIAADTITAPAANSFFTISTEGAAATDNLSTINGGYDGLTLLMRTGSSSQTVTLKAGGNIDISRDIPFSRQRGVMLVWDTGTSKWLVAASPVTVDSVNGKTGVVVLNKSDIGLDQVDNTSDANKPVSTAQATAIALKADKSSFASGRYTPALTATLNCSALTLQGAMYSKNNSIVTVSALITGTATAAGSVEVDIALPVASDLTANGDLNGTCATSSANPVSGAVSGNLPNNTAKAKLTFAAGGGFSLLAIFQYEVK